MYEKSIELLNKAVADEMYAVHQYMYFHFHCDDQGLELLANLFAPCNPVHATSPRARSHGTLVRPHSSTTTPPH